MEDQLTKEIQKFFSSLLGVDDVSPTLSNDDDLDITIVSLSVDNKQLPQDEDKQEFFFAVNSILKKVLERKFPEQNVVLDLNGEQRKFIEEAKQKAEIAYNRVLQYQKPYEFAYLNAFERMIVHSYLKQKDDVETSSSGKGRDRRLTVSLVS